jgi:hypothetical protein
MNLVNNLLRLSEIKMLLLFSVDGDRHFLIANEFATKVVANLSPAEKSLIERDEVLRLVLIVEFGTHHQNPNSSVQLCKLLCSFFAPLLTTAEVEVPAKMMIMRCSMQLTRRLLDYSHNLQQKAWTYFCKKNYFYLSNTFT